MGESFKNCIFNGNTKVLHNFYSLKSLDLVCMKKLDNKVNIIPVIAKADTISKPELMRFKVWIWGFGVLFNKCFILIFF